MDVYGIYFRKYKLVHLYKAISSGGYMFSLKVKGRQFFSGHEIPIIEGGFGEQERILMAKTIAEFHNIRTADVNRLINNNLDKFVENVDLVNICDLLINDKELREKLGLKSTEVTKNTKYVYVLSERGYIKLVAAMSNNNDTKWDVMKTFIDKYFKMRIYLDEIAGKLLSQDEVNEILKLTDQNLYIKDYIKILIPPRGKKGKEFKENEINKFIGKINCDVEKYLLTSLGVPDLEHIPAIAYKSACFLVKECYILPEDLKEEFFVLLNKLLDKRAEVIKDNQLKNAKVVQGFKEELEKIKLVIRGYLI